MRVEACCQSLLAHFLPQVDPERGGICLDVGVGTFAFYCQIFAKLGFKTIAVEPLPIKKLRQLAIAENITLLEQCLSDQDGEQSLYLGRFAGVFNSNFSSLSPDWFGSSSTVKRVPSQTLLSLIPSLSPDQITCLKLDIEGWEFNVLKQLPDLAPNLRPKIIMFEYGGGVNKNQQSKGWSREFFAKTVNCLRVLRDCGYGDSIMADFAPNTQERCFNLQSEPDLEMLFSRECVYGNIISFLEFSPSLSEIAQVCTPYYAVNPIERLVTAIVSR